MNLNSLESPFEFEELFYSRTDRKGIIRSGNSVFQRVSGYPWGELVDRPHNLIRHPDMPRGVFCLLWDYLGADRPIGAFVKNRSKDGRHYWVFALALPAGGGFLSVRMKPGGDLLKIVEQAYAELRAIEHAKKISPQESRDLLLQKIGSLGFAGYPSFMAVALADQIAHRSRSTGQAVPFAVTAMTRLRESCAEISRQTELILGAYQKAAHVPLNLEVSAARLGENGRQISVVANQYQQMATDIKNEISQFAAMSRQVSEKIEEAQFHVGASQLFSDVEKYLSQDAGESQGAGADLEELRALAGRYLTESRRGLGEIREVTGKFITSCDALQSLGAGLEIVRITGTIENAWIPQGSEVGTLLSELKEFQTLLSVGLLKILERSDGIRRGVTDLLGRLVDASGRNGSRGLDSSHSGK